jgi:hypothetical protein
MLTTTTETQETVVSDRPLSLRERIDVAGRAEEKAVTLQTKLMESVAGRKAREAREEADAMLAEVRAEMEDGLDPEEERALEGIWFFARVGPQAHRRAVTNALRVFELLGVRDAIKLVSFRLKDLDAYLTQRQRDEVTTSERSGARRFSIQRRA